MNVNTITYNKQFIETSGSDLVLNVDSFNEFEILLKNNITLSLSNINGNKKITIWLVQDGTGSRTVTFSSQFTFTDVNVNTVTSTANATTVQKFDINSGKVYCSYTSNAAGGGEGSGTVTSVSVVTANGVSGSVADETTTPAITLTLDHIVPNSATITPLDDRQALTIRRNNASQTNHILDVQTEANGQLAYIDKDGNISAPNINPLIPTEVTYTTAIPFDRVLTMMAHTLDANDTLTVNSTSAFDGGGGWVLYTNNGTNEPVTNAFKVVSGSYDKTKAYSLLVFARVNGLYTVSITNFN